MATAGTGVAVGTGAPAAAEPVYEITAGRAEGTPTQVASDDVVNAEWRIHVNDDGVAPSNEPVDDVAFTLTIGNGAFEGLPDSCLVDGARRTGCGAAW